MTLELHRLQETTFAAAASYSTETFGRTFSKVYLDFQGTFTSSAACTPRNDGGMKLLGDVELVQAGERLAYMKGETARHLGALNEGGYGKYLATAPAAAVATNVLSAGVMLDFGKMIPGMRVNASENKAILRGQNGNLDDYLIAADTGKVTAASLTLDMHIESTGQSNASGFPRPAISQETFDLSSAGELRHTIHFNQDTILAGIFLEAVDASGGTSTEDHNTDGLIRRIRVETTRKDAGTQHRHYVTWSAARKRAASNAGFSAEDYERAQGSVFLPLQDDRTNAFGGAMIFRAGESISITFDTQSATSAEFTAVTPANGDHVRITTVAATWVPGSGDVSPQSPSIPVSRPSGSRTNGSARRGPGKNRR